MHAVIWTCCGQICITTHIPGARVVVCQEARPPHPEVWIDEFLHSSQLPHECRDAALQSAHSFMTACTPAVSHVWHTQVCRACATTRLLSLPAACFMHGADSAGIRGWQSSTTIGSQRWTSCKRLRVAFALAL